MNPHLKQLWAAMRLPENFKKSYKFFCRGLDIRVPQTVEHDTGELRVCILPFEELLADQHRLHRQTVGQAEQHSAVMVAC